MTYIRLLGLVKIFIPQIVEFQVTSHHCAVMKSSDKKALSPEKSNLIVVELILQPEMHSRAGGDEGSGLRETGRNSEIA
jgi:hypothetical protein